MATIAYVKVGDTEDGAALSEDLTKGHSLGVLRAEAVDSKYAIAPLLTAARTTSTAKLYNPNLSPGCSPLIRLLLVQAGLACSIVNELSHDSQPRGHEGGNALDIGPGDGGITDLRIVTDFLADFAPLFSCVAYKDMEDDTSSFYIWDGVVVDSPSDMTGLGSGATEFAVGCQDKIHVASSFNRFYVVLSGDNDITGVMTPDPATASYGSADRLVTVVLPDYSDSVSAAVDSQPNNTRW